MLYDVFDKDKPNNSSTPETAAGSLLVARAWPYARTRRLELLGALQLWQRPRSEKRCCAAWPRGNPLSMLVKPRSKLTKWAKDAYSTWRIKCVWQNPQLLQNIQFQVRKGLESSWDSKTVHKLHICRVFERQFGIARCRKCDMQR